ncbi:MAG TPA: spore germination protein [Clostridiales bacterium]|nr:spore germination protein [Clostridiales bacterium]
MKGLFKLRKKQEKVDAKVADLNQPLTEHVLTASLTENIAIIDELFADVDIMRKKYIDNMHDKKIKYCIVYTDGVVNNAIIDENLIKPLLLSTVSLKGTDPIETVMTEILQINEMEETESFREIVEAVTYGDTVLFVEGAAKAVILNTKCFDVRAISEPESEKNLSGPREGFTEALLMNLSLVRRKVRTADLKVKCLTLGRRTKTKVAVCYMDGIVNQDILAEVYRRLAKVDIDAILDTNYITELVRDNRWSPFRTSGYTERPDVVVGKIMEGRVAIFVDGTPTVMTVPYLFIENFQSSEDYYLSFYYTSFSRMIRILGFFLTISVPGFYIAIVAFHHEMMPLQLFISITAERQSVPLPAALEAVVMLLVFDIIRETGVRMPSNIGQAFSIVGALVIGQAGVEAKLVAAPMIIIIGLTGITSLLVPKMNASVIYIRVFLLILASTFGLFGLILGLSCVFIHMLNLRSFGIPQLSLVGKLRYQDVKDTYGRAPWWQMIQRPLFAANKVRGNYGGDHHD